MQVRQPAGRGLATGRAFEIRLSCPRYFFCALYQSPTSRVT